MTPPSMLRRYRSRTWGVRVIFADPCWLELHARPRGAVDFFSSVFSLEAHAQRDTKNFRYTLVIAEGQEVAGILDTSQSLPEGVASQWVVSWHVTNLDTALARLRQLGATVHDGATFSPFGRVATVANTTGAILKLRGCQDESIKNRESVTPDSGPNP